MEAAAQEVLMQECEGFMSKGISGSGVGFDAASVGRLGGRGPVPIHNPPSHQAKSLALKVSRAQALTVCPIVVHCIS